MNFRAKRLPIALGLLATGIAVALVAGMNFHDEASGNVQDDRDCNTVQDWPFETVSCEMFQTNGARVARATESGGTAMPSEEAASAALQNAEDGTVVLETKLVEIWSVGAADPGPRETVYAVVLDTPSGPGISGGGILADEIQKVVGSETRPLTEAETAAIHAAVNQRLAEIRASISESFHIAYIDPVSGEWLGAREGVRTH